MTHAKILCACASLTTGMMHIHLVPRRGSSLFLASIYPSSSELRCSPVRQVWHLLRHTPHWRQCQSLSRCPLHETAFLAFHLALGSLVLGPPGHACAMMCAPNHTRSTCVGGVRARNTPLIQWTPLTLLVTNCSTPGRRR